MTLQNKVLCSACGSDLPTKCFMYVRSTPKNDPNFPKPTAIPERQIALDLRITTVLTKEEIINLLERGVPMRCINNEAFDLANFEREETAELGILLFDGQKECGEHPTLN